MRCGTAWNTHPGMSWGADLGPVNEPTTGNDGDSRELAGFGRESKIGSMRITLRDLLWLILACAIACSWRVSDGQRVAELQATIDRHQRVKCAPRLFHEHVFTAESFAEAVNHFVGLGEDAAVRELEELAQEEHTDCVLSLIHI